MQVGAVILHKMSSADCWPGLDVESDFTARSEFESYLASIYKSQHQVDKRVGSIDKDGMYNLALRSRNPTKSEQNNRI
jgi:hypothetical protein